MIAAPTDDPLLPALRALVAGGRFREALARHRGAAGDPDAARPEAVLLAATAALRTGDVGTALGLGEAALEQFARRADQDGRMRAANLLGAIAFEQGRLGDAEAAFGDALRIARDLGDTLMAARASNNLASVAHLRGRPDLALSLYRAALLDYQRLGDRRGAAETYHNLGLCFRQLGELDDAEAATEQALRHAEAVREAGLLALAVSGRAELALERQAFDVATGELARAGTMARDAGDELGEVEVQRLVALLALRQGDAARAAREAEVAREAAARQGSALLAAECAAVAALACRRLGQAAQAELRRAEALAGFERLGATGLAARFEEEWGLAP